MKELKELIRRNLKQYTMFILMLFIVMIFQITTKGVLLVPQNFSNLVLQNAYVVVLSVGMMICIITGGNVDLSVGSVAAFIGAICGILIIDKGINPFIVIAICVVISLLIGAWQRFWIAYFKVPSFIATLSGMLVFRGLTYYLLNGKTFIQYPPEFSYLTTGFLPNYFDGEKKFHLTTMFIGVIISIIYILLELRKYSRKKSLGVQAESIKYLFAKLILVVAVITWSAYTLASHKGMPMVLIPVAFIVLVYNFYMKNTVGGRHVYALGGNEKAARLSGINVKRTLFLTYVNMAFLSCIAGLIFTARLNAASPKAGDGFELDAIAACYIGGASSSGGIGSIVGALIGALVMGILNNGMSIMGFQMDIQMVIKGLVLLFAVVIDLIQRNKAKV